MAFKIYNTATRTKENFNPQEPGKVGIYVCGVTVYDLCHVGHARSAVVFDVLVRYLRASGYAVTYVRNFTDVDDKIIARAERLGRDTHEIAREFIDAFYDDMDRLNVLRADHEPRATEHIEGMIATIMALLERGHAYAADGDVFFSVDSFPGYGALSGRKLDDMKAGTRFAVDEKKKHPLDFVLWKAAKPGEPNWPSPWGKGRPGWHIECSVMSNHFLGPSFDIHGGGRDLLFPHHENERAQSMGANDGSFARYWVHNGFVTVESEKMSKSTGNFLTIRDALAGDDPQVLRLFLLSQHYRRPLDFSKEAVAAMRSGLVRIYRTLGKLEELIGPPGDKGGYDMDPGQLRDKKSSGFLENFTAVMDDDLNTAGAIGLIFEKVRGINRLLASTGRSPGKDTLHELRNGRGEVLRAGAVLGLFNRDPENFFRDLPKAPEGMEQAEIEGLVGERDEARAARDWARADSIRDRLKEAGVVLEDGPEGTSWRRDV